MTPPTPHPRLLVTCEDEANSHNYLGALAAVGFDPSAVTLVVPAGSPDPRARRAEVAALAAQADGVLLCGGPDVEPHQYGESPRPDAGLETMPELDAIDLGALDGAHAHRRPVLAICRGLQVTNVWAGGSLWQDLASQAPSAVTHRVPQPKDALAHPVWLLPEIRRRAERGDLPAAEIAELATLFVTHERADAASEPGLAVNSRHHQAIRQLGRGLHALATSPDGLVEAAAGETPGWWLWGVQWHPENLLALPAHRSLFTAFRDAVLASCAEAAGRPHGGLATPRPAPAASSSGPSPEEPSRSQARPLPPPSARF
jgi:putative glutamine amidotransferase